jgi:hypothetical protein
MAAILYGVPGLGTGAGNDLVAAGCFLGVFIVAAAWLKHLAIPFVITSRLASGLTIQDAIARRRERRDGESGEQMREVKAPSRPGFEKRVFLAGSIEMGKAEQWQERIVNALSDAGHLVILNPRRDDWDDSWEQRADNPQLSWELDMLDAADIVVMYLAPGTKSPVSLLELGLCARSGKLKVCCPEGFWRRGNVEVVCQRNRIPLYGTLDALLHDLMAELA